MNQVTINGGQFNTLLTQKLRLTKKMYVMLSITSSKLEKYIKEDSSFQDLSKMELQDKLLFISILMSFMSGEV